MIDLLFKFISSIRWSEEDKRDIFFCHKKIAEKVEQKDPKGARKAMLEHLGDMGRILSRYPMKDVLE
ncbi:MAG: FCD domain-containing protein [Pseudomonadota bacterium]